MHRNYCCRGNAIYKRMGIFREQLAMETPRPQVSLRWLQSHSRGSSPAQPQGPRALSSRSCELRGLPGMGDWGICHGLWRKAPHKADQSDRLARLRCRELWWQLPPGVVTPTGTFQLSQFGAGANPALLFSLSSKTPHLEGP